MNHKTDNDRSLLPDKILKLRITLWYSRKQKSKISRYFNDDFEVDHMICPNCGAAVIIKEYSFPAVKIKMDEIDVFCSKCKQLLCTKPADNHYLAELLD